MPSYAFRAEADIDRTEFFNALAAAGIAVPEWAAKASVDYLGGVQCEIQCDADLDTLLAVARTIPDTHILRRTLQVGTLDTVDVGEYANPEE